MGRDAPARRTAANLKEHRLLHRPLPAVHDPLANKETAGRTIGRRTRGGIDCIYYNHSIIASTIRST
jgi:hypothetical protein